MGLIELKGENYSVAIQYFEKAIPLLPGQHQISEVFNEHAMFIEPLALAYFKSGKLEEAKKEFDAITRLTYGRLYYGDIYAKSFYMLGKIYEQQGNITQAVDHYEKFLDLWKEADPGIVEVEDARERLSSLTENQ
jgi:tetratricopeptide (TPR) repeat protein